MNLAKRFVLGLAGVVLLVLSATLALHHNGSIETDVLIDTPPQAVWKVLTATSDYPSWNPEISRLDGQIREGNVVEFVEGTGSDAMVFHPRILVVQPNRELRWKGYVWLPGLFDGEHRFLLEAKGGKTRLVQSETFTGILSGKLTEGILQHTAESMQAMNGALKERAEQLSK